MTSELNRDPLLWRHIDIPDECCHRVASLEGIRRIGGDIRIGDLTGNGVPDIVVYRSLGHGHDEGGMIPHAIGAFDLQGNTLWRHGEGGEQPCRPGPVLVHDLDADGQTEVVCLHTTAGKPVSGTSMEHVVIQIRDGRTGEVLRENAPEHFRRCSGQGPDWAHQRLLAADLRGNGHARDIVIKLGASVLAFSDDLDLLWAYECDWTEYGHCPSYIPAVGDIDGDGRDEVLGGYYLIDNDGALLWERNVGLNMDSVAIAPWDGGTPRAICSGFGQVLDASGHVCLCLGSEEVPHGQEVRVGRFDPDDPDPQMVIRWNGHATDMILVNTRGDIVNRFNVNESPNNTGMEVVHWDGPHAVAKLYNGGMIWNPLTGEGLPLPGLPEPEPVGRMAWYHCIAADIRGDAREDIFLYNPWEPAVRVYTPAPLDDAAYRGWQPGPKQVNPRLMD